MHKDEEGGDVSEYVLEIVEGPEAGRRISLSGELELGRDPAAGGPGRESKPASCCNMLSS